MCVWEQFPLSFIVPPQYLQMCFKPDISRVIFVSLDIHVDLRLMNTDRVSNCVKIHHGCLPDTDSVQNQESDMVLPP